MCISRNLKTIIICVEAWWRRNRPNPEVWKRSMPVSSTNEQRMNGKGGAWRMRRRSHRGSERDLSLMCNIGILPRFEQTVKTFWVAWGKKNCFQTMIWAMLRHCGWWLWFDEYEWYHGYIRSTRVKRRRMLGEREVSLFTSKSQWPKRARLD